MALNAVLFSNIPGDSSSYTFSGGTLPTAGECGFVYADHTFDHWNTSDDDSGDTYYAGDTFYVGPGLDTLYAIWSGVEAHDVVISYQGADIATLDSTGSAVLATDGTLMADDVTISYTKSAAPVTSVNGKTGAVILTAADVGASTSDVKVTQAPVAAGSLTLWRPVVLGYQGKSSEDASFSDTTNSVMVNDSVRYQPSTGTLKATTFKGNLTGNVTGTASGNYSASNPPPYPVTSVNGNTGAVTIPDEIYIGTTTPTDSGVDVWIDTGSSGTLQNVVCSVNGISPTSSGNVDLIPGDRPTYYIDGTNGSDSNDGSQSRPFSTINKALDLIKAYKVQTVYPAIVYIAEGTYDEFLDLRRFPLELNINLQGDVTISGILCVHSSCFINGDSDGGHKLTVQYSSNVTYPWGKTLINVSQGSTFDIKSGSSGSVELKTTDNTVLGIWVGRECNSYIQKVVFTGTFAFPISIENTEAKIGSIVSSGTNIGRIRESGTLFLGDINGGVNYTGTTIDGTSRIIFNGAGTFTSGTDGIWTYQKYSDGTYHAWCNSAVNLAAGTAWAGGYYHLSTSSLTPPSFSSTVNAMVGAARGSVLMAYVGYDSSTLQSYWLNGTSSTLNGVSVRLDLYGTW